MNATIYETPHDFCHVLMNAREELRVINSIIFNASGDIIGAYKGRLQEKAIY